MKKKNKIKCRNKW